MYIKYLIVRILQLYFILKLRLQTYHKKMAWLLSEKEYIKTKHENTNLK